jgi:hypothetical protein
VAGAVAESGSTILFVGAGVGMIVLAIATAMSRAWRADLAPAASAPALGLAA